MTTQDKYTENKNTVISIIKYALIVGIVLLFLYYGIKLIWVIFPVLVGFVIAFVANHISHFIYKLFRRKEPKPDRDGKYKKSYTALKLLVYFLMLAFFVWFLIFVLLLLIAQIRNLIGYLDENLMQLDFIQNLSKHLLNLSDGLGGILPQSAVLKLTQELEKLQSDIFQKLPDLTKSFLSGLLSTVMSIPKILFTIIVTIMAGYYFIADRIAIDRFISQIFPSKVFVRKVVTSIKKVIDSFFRILAGYMVIMLVTFIEALIGLLILRIPYAIVVASAVMLLDLLPLVGAGACFAPISIYMFVQGRPVDGFIALVFVVVLTVVRSALEPRVVGRATRLHPLATLSSMLIGIAIFGLPGFIGGPLLVLFTTQVANEFGFSEKLRKKSESFLDKFAKSDSDESDPNDSGPDESGPNENDPNESDPDE